MAQSAIDGYLDAVEHGLAEDEYHSWKFLDRTSGNGKFLWWRLSDLTTERGGSPDKAPK